MHKKDLRDNSNLGTRVSRPRGMSFPESVAEARTGSGFVEMGYPVSM